MVLNSHLTNLGLGVIRPTQSLASSLVTDRITLNHLHSWGGGGWVITFSKGCNHKPHVDVGNAHRTESGQRAVDGSLLLLSRMQIQMFQTVEQFGGGAIQTILTCFASEKQNKFFAGTQQVLGAIITTCFSAL